METLFRRGFSRAEMEKRIARFKNLRGSDGGLPDSNNQPGSSVVVTVTNDFAPIAPLPFVPKTIKLTSTSRMVISR